MSKTRIFLIESSGGENNLPFDWTRVPQRNMKLIEGQRDQRTQSLAEGTNEWFEFEQSSRKNMNICNSIEPIIIVENWKFI